MAIGRISRIVENRGFGLIEEMDTREELAFHWSAIAAGNMDQLKVGQLVQFERQSDPRNADKALAVNVSLYDRPLT